MTKDIIKCEICGKEFVKTRKNTVCCSEPCARERRKMQIKEYQREERTGIKVEKKKKASNKNSNESLIAIATAAREAGMTYGKYVAMQYLKGERA